jgi:hypothetical protein
MNDELYDAMDALDGLNICVYTLVDGSKVIGEEIACDHAQGLVTMYGVLEFREIGRKSCLCPYVLENVDAEIVLNEHSTMTRSAASKSLKEKYFAALLTLHTFPESPMKSAHTTDDDDDDDDSWELSRN